MRKIDPIEKWTIIMLGSAAAYKVLLWQLGYQVDSQGPIWWGVLDILAVLRVVFALIGFVGFDLAIYALIADARSNGATAGAALVLLTAAIVSILIALDAASGWHVAALHAAPMVTLAAFALHLMFSHREQVASVLAEIASVADVPAVEQQAPHQQPTISIHNQIVQQVEQQALALPPTIPEYVRARAAELPELAPAALASVLSTSADTVRRALKSSSDVESITIEQQA